MRIYIDESGSFTGYHQNSISVVAALVIPDSSSRGFRRKYARIRESLPKENGEVKGRLLGAKDVNRVVRILSHRYAILEITAIDLALHAEAGILAYRQKLVAETRGGLEKIPEQLRDKVAEAVNFLEPPSKELHVSIRRRKWIRIC